MRATRAQLKRYVVDLATRLWTMGADLDAEPYLVPDERGALVFEITASLPDSGVPDRALLSVSERWSVVGREFERTEYAYDLVDHPRHRRRAYHLHDADRFVAAFDVAVHEHCEERLGQPTCDHYAGDPVSDAYRGIDLLMLAWTGEPLGCGQLRCLD